MTTTSSGDDFESAGKLSVAVFEDLEILVSAVSGVDIHDDKPRATPGGDPDIGVGPPTPPRSNHTLVGGCILSTMRCSRMFPWMRAICRAAGALSVANLIDGEDTPPAAGIVKDRFEKVVGPIL